MQAAARKSRGPNIKKAGFQILKLVHDKNSALSHEAPLGDSFGKEMLELHNQLRTEPGTFIRHLEARLNSFNDDSEGLVTRDSSGKKFVTVEGKEAVEECIKFLQN